MKRYYVKPEAVRASVALQSVTAALPASAIIVK